MIILVALIGMLIVLALAACNWRWSIKAVLVITVIEGGLRKWVLPQASEMIYFLKDGVLLGAYIGYCFNNPLPARIFVHRAVLSILLVGLTLITVLQTINPLLGSPLVGALGAKAYLFYIPLALVLPELFSSVEQLRSYLQWFLLLCLPVGLLGVVQFFSPANSIINVYAPSAADVGAATFGEDGNVRVTGTFPYIVGFSVYVVLCLALNFALLMHLRTKTWRLLFVGMQGLLAVDLLMTGSRGAAIGAAGLLAGFMIFSLFEKSSRNRRLGVLLVFVGFACFFGTATIFPSAFEAFRQRATDSGDSITGRIIDGIIEPFGVLDRGGLLGFGTGASQVACFALRERLQLGPPPAYPPQAEGEPLRVMLEIGVFGFVCWYALRTYLLVMLWIVARRVRHPMLRHLGLAAFLMHALFFTGQLVTNTTFSIFYWFLTGFIFLLPELDRRYLLTQPRPVQKPRQSAANRAIPA